MAGISRSKFIPVLLILLWVLLDCPCAVSCLPVPGDVYSVYYDFNISSETEGWCMVKGHMDEKYSFSYDCGNDTVISVNLPRKEVMVTNPWRQHTQFLRDLGIMFKQHLPDIKPEKNADGVPFPLQVTMTCQRNASGNISASWVFGWNGQRVLLFEGGKYTMDHPRGKEMKEKWEKDKELTDTLKFTSMGDCNKWLPQFIFGTEEPETAGAPITAPAAATPSTVTAAPVTATAAATTSTVTAAPVMATAAATTRTVTATPVTATAAATTSTVTAAPVMATAAATASTVPAAQAWTNTATIVVIVIILVVVVVVIVIVWFLRSNRRCGSDARESVVSSSSSIELQKLKSSQQMQRPPEDREDTADAIAMSLIA